MKILFKILGFIFLGIGCIGMALPLLPTTPFFLIAAFFFAKSSKKLHDWFISTNLYKKNLDSFVNEKSMTIKTKLSILISVTILLGICFFGMKTVLIGRIAVVIVWACHILYFGFRVKTIHD